MNIEDGPPSELRLTRIQKRCLGALANEAQPYEGVAVLIGGLYTASDAWSIVPLENEAPATEATSRCEVSVEQLAPLMKTWREGKLTIHAWWHSHPTTKAYPSELDRSGVIPLQIITTCMELRNESQRHRAWWNTPATEPVEVWIP